jgi:hypothetical protein
MAKQSPAKPVMLDENDPLFTSLAKLRKRDRAKWEQIVFGTPAPAPAPAPASKR